MLVDTEETDLELSLSLGWLDTIYLEKKSEESADSHGERQPQSVYQRGNDEVGYGEDEVVHGQTEVAGVGVDVRRLGHIGEDTLGYVAYEDLFYSQLVYDYLGY